MDYISYLLEDLFNFTLKKPILNKEYIMKNKNPFEEIVIVKPVEIKGVYIKYLYKFSDYETGNSCRISIFNGLYKQYN